MPQLSRVSKENPVHLTHTHTHTHTSPMPQQSLTGGTDMICYRAFPSACPVANSSPGIDLVGIHGNAASHTPFNAKQPLFPIRLVIPAPAVPSGRHRAKFSIGLVGWPETKMFCAAGTSTGTLYTGAMSQIRSDSLEKRATWLPWLSGFQATR